ncbi:uncharacterized protein zgc:193711 [Clupea harengus]|uniref:Uncharacterized protein zgc:193711 n=1 Tax=Clupea harengus TaxID=7950 RepID=A0A8M1KJW1_CLUHA|nr:uncharacterized protein zgc:193711 [Clupea harengus]
MGNNITRTIDKWGVNPRKITLRSKKRKGAQPIPQQTADVHHDSAVDEPVYARVNKKRRPEDELHYAEIQVVQPRQMASRGRQRPPPVRETEYATVDFNTTAHTMAPIPTKSEPADILIPPGALQRPKPKSYRKRTPSPGGAVLV